MGERGGQREDDGSIDTGKIDLLLAETRVHGYPDTRMSLGIRGLVRLESANDEPMEASAITTIPNAVLCVHTLFSQGGTGRGGAGPTEPFDPTSTKQRPSVLWH